jgi:hypothetical protein
MTTFPIDLTKYQRITLDASKPTLTAEQKATLIANIQLCRDAIVFFTAWADIQVGRLTPYLK